MEIITGLEQGAGLRETLRTTERDVENVLMASVYHGTEFQCLHLNFNWCSCLFIQLHLKQKARRDANVD